VAQALSGYDFSCDSPAWHTHNAAVKCSTFGKERVIEVADAGNYTHAYQEMAVAPGRVYKVSGEFYPLAAGECDGSVAVKWCSPSVVILPGEYDAEFYLTSGSYVGIAPSPTVEGAWEAFVAHFTSTSSVATLYIIQESTTHNSIVRSLVVEDVGTFSCDESGCASASPLPARDGSITTGAANAQLRRHGTSSDARSSPPTPPIVGYDLTACEMLRATLQRERLEWDVERARLTSELEALRKHLNPEGH
jgi:hypothetical protein